MAEALNAPVAIQPRSIQIEASSSCQLRCPSCPTATGATRATIGRGFLDPQALDALLAANPGIRQVALSNYGEMFLNPKFVDLLRVCDAHNIAITGNNGVNLNTVRPEMLDALVVHRMRVLTVSIDGASQETYQAYRVGGDFGAVIANIVRINAAKRRLGSEFPRLRWQFIIFGHNEHEIEAARAMAGVLGMSFFAKLSWDNDISPVRNPEAVRRAVPESVATRAEFTKTYGQDYVHGICHQLWDSPQINWDGKLLGCCRNFWGDFGANVFADGFEAAVNGERMEYARSMLRGVAEPRADVPCTTCDIYHTMQAGRKFIERNETARG